MAQRPLCAVLILGAMAATLRAQPPTLAFGAYRVDTWRAGGGLPGSLPSNNVNFLAQSADGYLWLATPAGLTRFDGLRFELMTPALAPALRDRLPYLTWPMWLDRRGALWVTTDRGMIQYADGAFTPAPPDTSLGGEPVQQLGEDSLGALYGVTVRGSVFRIRDGKEERMPLPDVPVSDGFGIVVEPDGTLWIARDEAGLIRFRAGRTTRFGSRDG